MLPGPLARSWGGSMLAAPGPSWKHRRSARTAGRSARTARHGASTARRSARTARRGARTAAATTATTATATAPARRAQAAATHCHCSSLPTKKSHGPATKKKDTPLAPPIAPGNAAHLTGRAGQGPCELRKAPPAGTPGRLPGAARGRPCPHQPAHTQLCGAQGGSSPRPRADCAEDRSARADGQEPALPGGGRAQQPHQ